MAAIGRIRKHGVLLMIIIGVALLAFIVGDLTRIIPSITNQNLLAKVGGESIRMENRENTYTAYYNQNRALMTFLNGTTSTDDAFEQSIHDFTWQQVKQEVLLDEQLENLGILFHDDLIANINSQLIESLSSQTKPSTNAEQYLMQMCYRLLQTNPNNTIETIIGALQSIDDYRGNDIYNMYKAIERIAVLDAKSKAYFGLVEGSTYFSTPLVKQIADNNTIATMQFAAINPNDPTFKDIKVTVEDKEIKDFFDAHKDRYYVKEDCRDIDFAIFPVVPTTKDRKDIADTVNHIFQRFATTNSIRDFARTEKRISNERLFSVSEGSFWSYNDYTANHVQLDTLMYLQHGKSALQKYQITQNENYSLPAPLDSAIFKTPAGTLIPPYLDGNFWYFGKVRDIAARPDSIRTTFLTIDFKVGQNSTSTRTKEQAKALADSLQQSLQSNPDPMAIFTLFPSYKNERFFQKDSTHWFEDAPDTMYNHLIATPIGGFYQYEAQDCYLIFQVLQKTQLVEKRQYVLYPVPVEASKATIEDLRSKANSLAAESDNVEKLNKLAQSKGAIIIKQTHVTNMQGVISTNMQESLMCREAISWAFEKETELGHVSRTSFDGRFMYSMYNQQPQLGDEAIIVAGLSKIQERGKAEFDNVKDIIKEELTAQKKKDAIEQQLKGEIAKSTIPELASKYNAQVRDSVKVSLMQSNPYGIENSAIGKIYTLAANSKPNVVSGKDNVYLVSIYNEEKGTATPTLGLEKNVLREVVMGRSRGMQQIVLDELESKITIIDRRHNFYKGNQ